MDNTVEVIRRGRNDEDKEQSLSGNHTEWRELKRGRRTDTTENRI